MLTLVKSSLHAVNYTTRFAFQRATLVTANELRSEFLNYFQSKNHTIVPGSSVIPEDDPSLLFVNAGMNQFKKNRNKRRLTTSQLCIRAGGKHNDLDNIGFTPRHQTMFEMLGNFSLGDYYKEEAIQMAYEFVTKNLSLPKEHLRVSVHEKDDTARSLWKKIAGFSDAQIVNRDDKDNFWTMGSDDSPSGFCSEIFFTTDPSSSYDDWLEIWNIVFMNTKNKGGWIDTGMGCERILSVLNSVPSNFDTDIFTPIIQSIHERFPQLQTSHQHIFADHLRTSVVLASQIFPSAKGRGYVMRKIIRRMMRYAYLNGISEPFIGDFVPIIIKEMQSQLPELPQYQQRIKTILTNEEEFFWRAVTDGQKLVTSKIKKTNSVIPISTLHRFHADTGLSIDMITTLLEENHIAYNKEEVTAWMNQEVDLSEKQQNGKMGVPTLTAMNQDLNESGMYNLNLNLNENENEWTCDVMYDNNNMLVLNNCPFYPEQAGQEGDIGLIKYNNEEIAIIKTIKTRTNVICIVKPHSQNLSSKKVHCQINANHRKQIAIHHTATHLLHSVLLKESGLTSSSLQEGSHITDKALTFDFYSGFLNEQMKNTSDFIHSVETQVNVLARSAFPVTKHDLTKAQLSTLSKGSFIGDIARISGKDTIFHTVTIGPSHEFCCGQHVKNSQDIVPFVITGVQSISAGIKRIEAKAGLSGIDELMKKKEVIDELKKMLTIGDDMIVKKVDNLVQMNSNLNKINKQYMKMALQNSHCDYTCNLLNEPVEVYELPNETPKEFIDELMMSCKNKTKENTILIIKNKNFVVLAKEGMSAKKCDDIKKALFKVGNGGKGGGKKGVLKGVCNESLSQKKEEFEKL